eukprot:scaffold446_cov183-Ochromonas_danica.AAC.3
MAPVPVLVLAVDAIQELLASPLRCELRIVEDRKDLPQVSIKDKDITLISDKPNQSAGIYLLVPEKCDNMTEKQLFPINKHLW